MRSLGGEDFSATSRFDVLRCIGSGGIGKVYEAFDKERNTRLALKTLHAMTGESIRQFEREFHDFQKLSHPNLVSVGELFSDNAQSFFSRELIDGVTLIEYVRPWLASSSGDDSARIRAAVTQVAAGLIALHSAHKVHGDLKPSNVLVTREGRVVLLDFGLATPEQAAGRSFEPSADWFAMGIVLFEALTGRLPFAGEPMEALMTEQRVAPPSPRSINAAVPEDLAQLCLDLLRLDPRERPMGAAVLERLGAATDRSRSLSLPAQASALFVGRTRELQQLEHDFELARKHARFVVLHGESGVGKTSLVRQFIKVLTRRYVSAVVLSAACDERESVPYAAVDGLIDSLGDHLQRLPKEESAAVLPRQAAVLADVFPALERIEAIARAPQVDEPREPVEQRGRLFAALRELFQRLADRRPTVIVIDDIQWADVDSLALLAEVLREPDSPTLLLVATVHTLEQAAALRVIGEIHAVAIDGLSTAEGCELALALIGQAGAPPGIRAKQVAQEAAGHPMFIDALIRYACTMTAPSQRSVQLDQALGERIGQLDPIALDVLQLICIAHGALVHQTVASAAGRTLGELATQIALLRGACLVQTSGVRPADPVAPYHPRVRAAVLARLPEDSAALHRRIALAFESSERPDPEALAMHWRDAGDRAKATRFAAIAARDADRAFAHERAVTFYRLALELGDPDGAHELRSRLADALVNAGHGAEAAAMFVTAAEAASAPEATVFRQRAALELLRTGHFDEAFVLFRTVQAAIEMPLAASATGAVARLGWSRGRLRLRGLRFRERDASEVAPAELSRIDTGFALALALSTGDTIRGADLQTRQLLAALAAGEPYRIARGIALEAAFNAASTGTQGSVRTARLVTTARVLAERIDNPHALGLAAWAAGASAYFEGRFVRARELCEQAVTIYRERCRGVAWEIASAQVFALWAALYAGAYREVGERLPLLIEHADGREDRYDATNLRTSHTNTVWLAADRPDEARAELDAATQDWGSRAFQLPQYYAVHAFAQHELYTGDADAAWARLVACWPKLKQAHLMRLPIIRIEASFLRARCALAVAARDPGAGAPFLKAAARDAAALDAERAAWASALAMLVRAGVAAAERTELAPDLYDRAASALDAVDMPLHAAVARRRRGLLLAGDAGAALVSAADGWMTAQAIRSPARMTGLLVPSRE